MLFRSVSQSRYVNWFFHIVLSALAFLFLPRQFQVSVVENVNEENIKQSIWLFPLYLFLINIFVIPVALAGEQLLAGSSVSRDSYVLAIPLLFSQKSLALLIYQKRVTRVPLSVPLIKSAKDSVPPIMIKPPGFGTALTPFFSAQ